MDKLKLPDISPEPDEKIKPTDLELNLKMMEAMGGAQIYGDKIQDGPSDDEIINKVVKDVNNLDSLGPAN